MERSTISNLTENPTDDEIVEIFLDFCVKLEDGQKCIKAHRSHKITGSEEEDLDKAVKEGRLVRKDYAGNLNSFKNKSSNGSKPLQVVESINRMRKHINKHARDMNKVLVKLDMEPVSYIADLFSIIS